MMKRFMIIGALGLGLMISGFMSCGGQNVCEEASDIIAQCQNLPTGGGSQAACEGVAECISQCVVDHPQGTCESLIDPNSTAADVLALNACSDNC